MLENVGASDGIAKPAGEGLALRGSTFFEEMEMAIRFSDPLSQAMYAKIGALEKSLELPLKSLRFLEGIPCDGESCSEGIHSLLRVTDPQLIPTSGDIALVCLKHKYLHLCGPNCHSLHEACRIAAWYFAMRHHRHTGKREPLRNKETTARKVTVCTKQTCKPREDDPSVGFVRVAQHIWVCKQHPRPHLCVPGGNNLCCFAEIGVDRAKCWATREEYVIAFIDSADKGGVSCPVDLPGIDLSGRLRKLPDGSITMVPWGLDCGEAIPEIEDCPLARFSKRRNAEVQVEAARELRSEQKAKQETHIGPDASIYHQYVGLLGEASLPDELGDYVTILDGQGGGGLEDEQGELVEQESALEEALMQLQEGATDLTRERFLQLQPKKEDEQEED